MIRQFKLKNRLGQVLDLNDPRHFGANPTGLGVNFDINYYSVFGHHRQITRQSSMNQITFDLIIAADDKLHPYSKYHDIIKFLNVGGLYLYYKTEAFDVKAKVDLVNISKSEIQPSGILQENLVLNKTTPWFKEKSFTVGEKDYVEGTGKIYTSEDNSEYGFIYGDYYGTDEGLVLTSEDTFVVNNYYLNDQNQGIGLQLVIESLVDNYWAPHVSLYNHDLGLKQESRVFIYLNKGDKLVISSKTGDYNINLFKAGSPHGLIRTSLMDGETAVFMRAYNGLNTLRSEKVNAGANDPGIKITVKYNEEYVVV